MFGAIFIFTLTPLTNVMFNSVRFDWSYCHKKDIRYTTHVYITIVHIRCVFYKWKRLIKKKKYMQNAKVIYLKKLLYKFPCGNTEYYTSINILLYCITIIFVELTCTEFYVSSIHMIKNTFHDAANRKHIYYWEVSYVANTHILPWKHFHPIN